MKLRLTGDLVDVEGGSTTIEALERAVAELRAARDRRASFWTTHAVRGAAVEVEAPETAGNTDRDAVQTWLDDVSDSPFASRRRNTGGVHKRPRSDPTGQPDGFGA